MGEKIVEFLKLFLYRFSRPQKKQKVVLTIFIQHFDFLGILGNKNDAISQNKGQFLNLTGKPGILSYVHHC